MAVLAWATDQADLRQRPGQNSGWPDSKRRVGQGGGVGLRWLHGGAAERRIVAEFSADLGRDTSICPRRAVWQYCHGNCSIVSDRLALRCADYVVTEAGFGSDLGADKFFNIKCRTSGLRPDVGMMVATLRALKLHGGAGVAKSGTPLPDGLTGPNQSALEEGFANLEQHIANVRAHGVPVVVAVNAFSDDSSDELNWVCERAKAGARMRQRYRHIGPTAAGGRGTCAGRGQSRCARRAQFKHLYDLAWPIKKKIETIATTMYGAAGVSFQAQAERDIELATRMGFIDLPICMAKTPRRSPTIPLLKGGHPVSQCRFRNCGFWQVPDF